MAHHVDKMAYVGQTPWHGLGNQLSSNQPIEVWEQQAGMNWAIKEAPVQFMDTVDETQSRLITYPQSKVLYRSDTQVPLSVVSQRYQVVQPREILEFYRDLTEVSGFQLETAGVLKGGKKIWALARTGQSSTIKGKRRDEWLCAAGHRLRRHLGHHSAAHRNTGCLQQHIGSGS
jgi:phage/plasmid-like protein (TIGR03299 family)